MPQQTERSDRPRPAPPADSPEATGARRSVRVFAGVLGAALLLGLVNLPWPWPLLTGLLCLVAVALGIRAFVRVRRAKVGGGLGVTLIAGVVLASVLTLSSATQAVLWREYSDYATCTSAALTEQARERCQVRLERDLDERLGVLSGR